MPTSSKLHIFQPIAAENLGSFDLFSLEFLDDLDNKIHLSSGEDKENIFVPAYLSGNPTI